jgi:hypothetical protein
VGIRIGRGANTGAGDGGAILVELDEGAESAGLDASIFDSIATSTLTSPSFCLGVGGVEYKAGD